MSLLSSLFKKSPPTIPHTDKVWKTKEAATKGMLMMAMMRLQRSQPCLILTFFESEKNGLVNLMNEHQIKHSLFEGTSRMDSTSEAIVYLGDANAILNSNSLDSITASKLGGEVFFNCHYPMKAPEQKLLEKLSSIGFKSFVFCLSFDDPLLKLFLSAENLRLLEKLGLDDNESLEHVMITKSISRAREKVNAKVRREIPAKSPEEWFALNVKDPNYRHSTSDS
jgi:preprotein translocase subunit SecA